MPRANRVRDIAEQAGPARSRPRPVPPARGRRRHAGAGAHHRIGRRGRTSDGVLLEAPDDPEVAAAIRRLTARGVPVVTLVTDVRDSGRAAYVGLDNAAAGATAAYLLSRCIATRCSDVTRHPQPIPLLRRARARRGVHEHARPTGAGTKDPHDRRDRRTRRHHGGPRRRGARRAPGHRGGLLGRGRQPGALARLGLLRAWLIRRQMSGCVHSCAPRIIAI